MAGRSRAEATIWPAHEAGEHIACFTTRAYRLEGRRLSFAASALYRFSTIHVIKHYDTRALVFPSKAMWAQRNMYS